MIGTIAALMAAQFSPFVLVDREDPITDKRQLALAVTTEDNLLVIGCSNPGDGQIFVRFIPDRYYGYDSDELLWEPNVVHRFGKDEPEKGNWEFYDDYIELGFLWSPNEKKARFLDSLAKNDRLILRHEARYGDMKTLVINYQLNNENLSTVITKCAPKRVTEYLREWRSPALQSSATE